MSMTDRYLREADRLDREARALLERAGPNGGTTGRTRSLALRARALINHAADIREQVRKAQEDADNAPYVPQREIWK